jgi:hypothetical protein
MSDNISIPADNMTGLSVGGSAIEIEVDWIQFGKTVAARPDTDQANLLEGFGAGLRALSTSARDTQLFYIVDTLGVHATELIKDMAAHIALKEEGN